MRDVDPEGAAQARTLTEAGEPSTPRAGRGDDRAGRNFAHFRVERRLGSGGMGEVYLATDLALDRRVALKFLGGEVAKSPQLRERFLREARAQARLNHPNVGHIYYVGEDDGQLFFAMELIEGESLQERLDRDKKLPPGEALELCRQAALGLREAHRHGFTHRDIKPSNLMVDRNGVLKIVDFGIVKQAPEAGAQEVGALTLDRHGTGTFLGTPHYVAPEQARGEPVDFRADIYSLGVTLHHLISGEPPFHGDTVMQIVAHHLADPRPRLGVSPYDLVVDRMMAKRPVDRFASYDDLVALLERFSPAISRPAGFWVRAFAVALDFLFVTMLLLPFEFLLRTELDDFVPILGVVYQVVTHARWGRTLGKAALDIEVVPWDRGGRLGFATAVRRALLQWGPCLVLAGIGWSLVVQGNKNLGKIFVLASLVPPFVLGVATTFSGTKRAFWDRYAGTLVRYRR